MSRMCRMDFLSFGLRSKRRKCRRHTAASPHSESILIESLETRKLLTVIADEQLFTYELNRARHDPVTYQQEQHLAVDLAYVTPRGPLALNDSLSGSSKF